MKFKFKSVAYVAVLCLLSITMVNCSSDDNNIVDPDKPTTPTNPEKPGSEILAIEANYSTTRLQVLQIKPKLDIFTNPKVTWKITQIDGKKIDSVISSQPNLDYITLKEGVYKISVIAQDVTNNISADFDINVSLEDKAYSPYILEVYDFIPAVGQFTNVLPKYTIGDTYESMVKKASLALSNNNRGTISLGGFGGYVEFKFDHTIINIPGEKDFEVLGNAFAGNSEPGIVQVAYDANKNGIADPEEWYEIAGSEHNNPQTIKNYEITFYKPSNDLELKKEHIDQYIKWEDNQGNSGYKSKNEFNSQSYYPQWIEVNKITFKGTKLRNNYKYTGENNSQYWTGEAFEYGYVDVWPNNSEKTAIDISWAVDQEGKSVLLPGIDFIRVHSAINQEAGNLGEVSTEVTGANDLHLLKK